MFRIGEFSKIAMTAVSQLRYYDQIGLFQPGHIDEFTGYRYYSAAQLPELNRILAMKELGLSLEQIKELVEDNVSAEELRGMLMLKKAQVMQGLQSEMKRLHHIEARLHQMEKGDDSAPDDVIIKSLPRQHLFGFRTILPSLMDGPAYRIEINELVPKKIHERDLGYFAAIIHNDGFSIQDVDAELGYLMEKESAELLQLSSGHQLRSRVLDAVETAACIVRVGGMEKGYDCYGDAGHWLEANNYQLAGPIREVFIKQVPMERIDEMVCEIQMPITLKQETDLSRIVTKT